MLDDVISNSDSDLCFSKFATFYNQHDELAMQGKVFYQLDQSISKNGGSLFVLSQKFPLKNEQGQVYGSLGFSKYMVITQLLAFLNSHQSFQSDIQLTFNLQELLQFHVLRKIFILTPINSNSSTSLRFGIVF